MRMINPYSHKEYNVEGYISYLYEVNKECAVDGGRCRVTKYTYNVANQLTDTVSWFGNYWQRAWGDSSFPSITYWKDGISVGNFPVTADWQELSGLTAAYRPENSAYMWILSDHPADMIAAVSKTNASNQGVWTLTGAATSVDWEDVESSVVNGIPYLYVFDYGNNPDAANSRGVGIDMRIHRVVEPTVTGVDGSTADFISIDCVFPPGNPPTHRDCEGSIIDPATGDIYIITKREAIPGVYFLPHQESYTGIQTLSYLGKMWDIPDVTTLALGATAVNVVDATINKQGTEIIVKNYNDLYLFRRDIYTQSIFQALQSVPTLVVGYVGGGSATPASSHPSAEGQGEGIAYDAEGINLYSNSEYNTSFGSSATRYPFFKYERISASPTTVSFQDGVYPAANYAGTLDTYIWDTNPNTAYGTATAMVIDTTGGGSLTDQRKGLLKFDISSIPTNATIVGARLDLNITAEGQGWAFYKVLVPWTEASTYNSLVGGIATDGIKAATTPDCINGINLDTVTGNVRNNMNLATIQDWVTNPTHNYGWVLECQDLAGGDGIQFATREAAVAATRPKLTIRYIV